MGEGVQQVHVVGRQQLAAAHASGRARSVQWQAGEDQVEAQVVVKVTGREAGEGHQRKQHYLDGA